MHNLDRTLMESWDFESYPGPNNGWGGAGEWSDEAGWYGNGEGPWYEGEGGDFEEEAGWYDEGEGPWYEGEGEDYEGEGDWYGEGEGAWYEGESYDGESYDGNEATWYGEGEDTGYEGESYDGESYDGNEAMWYGEQGYGPSFEGPFEEVDEMALAAELLNVGSDQEFGQFLKGVMRHASRLMGGKGSPAAFGQLSRMLKGIGRQLLPLGGAAVGNMVAPGIGGVVGGNLMGQVGRLFGLETEGMSPEDEHYEVARRFVRLAGAAAQEVAQSPPVAPPNQVAQQALVTAAQQHAPGMMAAPGGALAPSRPYYRRRRRGRQRGTWIRQGDTIVLFGVR